jgi:hypothetical protein
MAFDLMLIHRIADDIETSAKQIKQFANSPEELQLQIDHITQYINTLISLNANSSTDVITNAAAKMPEFALPHDTYSF